MPTGRNSPFPAAVDLDPERLAEFCQRWKVQDLALFGSALRGTLRPDSDLDFLVTFRPDAEWSLLDHARMERELGELANRRVDLVSRRGIERSANWIRRDAILEEAQPIYAEWLERHLASARRSPREPGSDSET